MAEIIANCCNRMTLCMGLGLVALALGSGCGFLGLPVDPCFEPESCPLEKCCKVQGRCGHNGKRCAPRNDSDCKQSSYCQWSGRCTSLAVLKTTHTRVYGGTLDK